MGRPLRGELRVPGDKSISHRALILAAMAHGKSLLENLSPSEDVRSTWRCLRELGVSIHSQVGVVHVEGRDWRGLREPKHALDCGNSGTTMRLLMGVVAGQDFPADFTGDESLKGRPMARVAEPLRRMGARVDLSEGGRAPLTVRGAALAGVDFESPVPSAQLKSAVLLAGLLATGETSVREPVLSRDHTERLLPLFGGELRRDGLRVTVRGGRPLKAARLKVPGDPSSAAFWAVAAAIVPESELRLRAICMNPTRLGFLSVLERMGARIERAPIAAAPEWDEPVADLRVLSSRLEPAEIAPEEVPGLIDEVPILALAASQARGESRFRGLAELRHKESDRLAATARLLNALGGRARVEGDDLIVAGPTPLKGAAVSGGGDHRIAMTALVAGLASDGELRVEDADCAKISYPDFMDHLKRVRG